MLWIEVYLKSPYDIARPNKNNEIHGIIDLPSASSETSVSFFDETGEHLHSIDLGAQPGGLVGFEWLLIVCNWNGLELLKLT